MANRLNGDVIIVDSAMGNTPILGATSNLTAFRVGAISFFSLDTSGTVTITRANTSLDVVFKSNHVSVGILSNNGAVVVNPMHFAYPGGIKTNDLKVPSLVAGTAYIYLI